MICVATGSISHAGWVKRNDPDEKGYPSPSGWRLGMGLTTPPHKMFKSWSNRMETPKTQQN
jgi:hypothetical protein